MTKMPKSIRKHIRKEKARIRRGVLGLKKQKGLIGELYGEFFKEPTKNKQKSFQKTG